MALLVAGMPVSCGPKSPTVTFNTTDSGYMLTGDDLNKFLAVVLTRSYDDGGFSVVDPMTIATSEFFPLGSPRYRRYKYEPDPVYEKERKEEMKEEIKEDKEWMQTSLNRMLPLEGFDAKPLVDALHEVNQKSIRLTLPSDEAKGYVIDYDGRYDRYFNGYVIEEDGKYARYIKAKGGYGAEIYHENPKVRGRTWVSLPAYDREKGILLVYVVTEDPTHGMGGGAGYTFAYQYRDGALKSVWSAGWEN